jgi:hypothetical protein
VKLQVENKDEQSEATNVEHGPDKEATLNYIDKTYDMIGRMWTYSNRLIIAVIILSFLMLTISVGWISAKESFTLAGLGLKISLAMLLASGIVLIPTLYFAYYVAQIRITALELKIGELYRDVQLDVDKAELFDTLVGIQGVDVVFSLLGPSISSNMMSEKKLVVFFQWVILLLIAPLVVFIFPMVAEGAAIYRLASTVGWQQFWIWAPFVVFLLAALCIPILILADDRI